MQVILECEKCGPFATVNADSTEALMEKAGVAGAEHHTEHKDEPDVDAIRYVYL